MTPVTNTRPSTASPNGGRMGQGKGYYDRLLSRVRPEVLLVAMAFECQMFPEIPVAAHDVFMDLAISEKQVYAGRGRKKA